MMALRRRDLGLGQVCAAVVYPRAGPCEGSNVHALAKLTCRCQQHDVNVGWRDVP